MEETLRYIKVLNWGYGAFCGSFGDIAPLSLSQDFSSSLEQLEKRLAVVNSLSYEKMFVEATSDNGKTNLLKYQSTEDSIGYSLHFMRDREQVLEACKATFKGFKGCADKYKGDKLWNPEQLGTYRIFLDQLERALELRLKQFATAYDYRTISTDEPGKESEPQQNKQDIPQEIPTIYNTDKERLVFGNALEKQYMSLKDGKYKWTLTYRLLAYMCGRLYCGDRIKEDNSDYSQEYVKGKTRMPRQEVKALFEVDVASNRYSLKAPPMNSWKVDDLFKSNGASK